MRGVMRGYVHKNLYVGTRLYLVPIYDSKLNLSGYFGQGITLSERKKVREMLPMILEMLPKVRETSPKVLRTSVKSESALR